jgi:hypothetical protein
LTYTGQLQTQACGDVYPLLPAMGWPNPPPSQMRVTQAIPWPKWGWLATPNVFFFIIVISFFLRISLKDIEISQFLKEDT